MTVLENKERHIAVDNEGYLVNFNDWNEKVARELAAQEGISLLRNAKIPLLR